MFHFQRNESIKWGFIWKAIEDNVGAGASTNSIDNGSIDRLLVGSTGFETLSGRLLLFFQQVFEFESHIVFGQFRETSKHIWEIIYITQNYTADLLANWTLIWGQICMYSHLSKDHVVV